MGQKVTIGGDRLGAGKKMQTELHNYGMSSHNLSQIFRSTMGAGILYPSLVIVGERDDHFKIKLEQDIRTQPTVAPLFGSFKLQTDVFMCPIRLYQGLLHNNPTELGRQMANVKLPKLLMYDSNIATNATKGKVNECALLKYLGLSGLGHSVYRQVSRYINAIPALAYYDIFKNYYSNKQEENAYVITSINKEYKFNNINVTSNYNNIEWPTSQIDTYTFSYYNLNEAYEFDYTYTINGTFESNIYDQEKLAKCIFVTIPTIKNGIITYNRKSIYEWLQYGTMQLPVFSLTSSASPAGSPISSMSFSIITENWTEYFDGIASARAIIEFEGLTEEGEEYLHLQEFELSNIDKMRYDILKHQELGESFLIRDVDAYLPYKTLVAHDSEGKWLNGLPLNGLCVKTYQNDIFNNWINSEWIDGENGVSELSKILVEDGAIKIDALQFAKKVYNLYNRVSISGATYYEWQNVVWSESKQTHVESPVYVGGYASEVMFEEIVQQSPTEIDGESQPLGTLGGKGKLVGKKGGYIEVDCDEACFIIAITSLTPRVSYTQGNEFYMTELDSIDDLHKPEFDGIGFQDLVGERMLWSDTKVDQYGNLISRTKIGKLPAWIEYQTAVDKTYGDFADENKAGYMVLTRKYEANDSGTIKDVTTYIDPTMYNYAFAVTDIDAQNFWLQANYEITARRRMSAHLIPQA